MDRRKYWHQAKLPWWLALSMHKRCSVCTVKYYWNAGGVTRMLLQNYRLLPHYRHCIQENCLEFTVCDVSVLPRMWEQVWEINEDTKTVTILLISHCEWFLVDIVHPLLLKKEGIMWKQQIQPSLMSYEEQFFGVFFLQKHCNNMSFSQGIHCKTLCKIIEEVRARKLHPIIFKTKGKISVAAHFNQVPICFFDVKRFFIVTIITFQFECLQFHVFLVVWFKEVNNTKTNHCKALNLELSYWIQCVASI